MEDLNESNSLLLEVQEEDSPAVVSRIIKPKPDSGRDSPAREQENCRSPLSSIISSLNIDNTCGLLRLPVELLDLIFQDLDIKHAFYLGLQSRYLWAITRKHIEIYRASPCGAWAGSGIMCVGDYIKTADCPPNTLTKSEKEELQKGLDENEIYEDVSDDQGYKEYVASPTNLYDLAGARYQQVKEWHSSLADELIGGAANLGEWHRLPKSRRELIFEDLDRYKLSDFYPEDQPWILRNLTTQEYVRSEAIAVKPEYIHGPHIERLGFGHVVWSRICWSSDNSCSMSYTGNIHRGVWAGHRFDITTLDRHKRDSSKQTEWKDISQEIADEIAKIWSSEFGSDWRNLLSE